MQPLFVFVVLEKFLVRDSALGMVPFPCHVRTIITSFNFKGYGLSNPAGAAVLPTPRPDYELPDVTFNL